MGNKLCKKKVDTVDNPKPQTPFDRIITRLHLRPSTWKSDPELNSKRVNRSNSATHDVTKTSNTRQLRPLSSSKSSDWTDATLEVPEKEAVVHHQNPDLSIIFNHDGTPTPPPRKHKKGLRAKIESVARNHFPALQSRKPVEEPLCIKKTYNYGCPIDDHGHHNRGHKQEKRENKEEIRANNAAPPDVRDGKDKKRKKNLSVVSLPNYNDLKLSLAKSETADKKPSDCSVRDSALSLPGESRGKLEIYMTRCRSFGSLLPQQLANKLRARKASADVESDDSLSALEDWDLGIIEHYNPKDASLPRPRKPPQQKANTQKDEQAQPMPPVRRSESLLKKLNRKASESANIRKSNEMLQTNKEPGKDTPPSITPPPSPELKECPAIIASVNYRTQNEDGKVEHSSLLKILEDFSVKDKQAAKNAQEDDRTANILTVDADKPSNGLEHKITPNAIEDFINTERQFVDKDVHSNKLNNFSLPQNIAPVKT